MSLPQVVSREEWLGARREFLRKEKEFTRARDALNAERRELPMVEVDKDYVFEGPDGKIRLLDMFEGRRQLIVHHVMFDPSWDEGCGNCRFQVRDLGHLPHLHEKDTTLALVSRAPYPKIAAYRERMGWTVPYYSSYGDDFNYDYHATLDESVTPLLINFRTKEEHEAAVGPWDIWGTELPGLSVFLREGDQVFHTYSTYARGLDILLFTLNYLDLTPLGRQDP
ncbi:DUF899 domain-containing protein [Amycolatopsis sp. CA-126428]|uniref:DUF899 domain-containing protein n=1 Tax=Amycolatopsis sp. CA-126428 TaxID=2073158 RepID=UPI000CD163D6|nr:DUF899 domain-containing protein [Amycolatopsis sp. CA-126428]